MKRREFISLFIGSLVSVSYAKYGANLLQLSSLDTCNIDSMCKQFHLDIVNGIINLPSDVESYDTSFSLNVKFSTLPQIVASSEMINGISTQLVLDRAGIYNFQYLGPFYGWSVT